MKHSSSQFPVLGSRFSVIHGDRNRTFLRWLKFNAVGGIGIGVQLVVLTVLRSWLKLDYLLATGLAVEIAAIHNFLWHSYLAIIRALLLVLIHQRPG